MAYWHLNQLIDHGKLKTLSLGAGYLAQYLAGKFDDAGRWKISRDRIRGETGRSHATIARALRELEAGGLIVIHKAGKRSAAEYFHAVTCPSDCTEKSHRQNPKKLESPMRDLTESPTRQAAESPTSEATYKPLDKPLRKERDLQGAGLEYLVSLLTPCLEVKHPAKNHLALAKAIKEKPLEVEQLIEERLKRATTNERAYLESVFVNNPYRLVPQISKAEKIAKTRDKLLKDLSKEADKANPRLKDLSEANREWLGDRFSHHRLSYARKASQCGLEIPAHITETLEGGLWLKEQLISSHAPDPQADWSPEKQKAYEEWEKANGVDLAQV